MTPEADFTAGNTSFTCTEGSPDCDAGGIDPIINAVCCQPGIPKKSGGSEPNNTTVTVNCNDANGNPLGLCNGITIPEGAQIEVIITSDFYYFISGSSIWPWGGSMQFTTDASMRYEG